MWKREPELPMKIYAQFERAKGGLLIVFQCLPLIPQLLLVSRFVSPVLWWSPGCFRSTWATSWCGIASGGTCTAARGISRMSGSWSAKGVSGLDGVAGFIGIHLLVFAGAPDNRYASAIYHCPRLHPGSLGHPSGGRAVAGGRWLLHFALAPA